ncbi:MAG: PolC-type DNA polymerase III [Christensenellales bacterium]|jgi:DNA polymerase-3 subunit alpha (Gram-positive type)
MLQKRLDWKAYMTQIEKSILEQIRLADAQLNRHDRTLHLTMDSPLSLEPDVLSAMTKAFTRLFPEFTIEIQSRIHARRALTAQALAEVIDECAAALEGQMPSLKQYLHESGCVYDKSAQSVTLSVKDAAAADILRQRNTGAMMLRWLQERFDGVSSVTFEALAAPEDDSAARAIKDRELAERRAAEKIEKTIRRKAPKKMPTVLLGKAIHSRERASMDDLHAESGTVTVEGKVFSGGLKALRNSERCVVSFNMTDYTSSFTAKCFCATQAGQALLEKLSNDTWVVVRGNCEYDRFSRETVLLASDIQLSDHAERMDDAPEKRVELHLHTKMSAMDAVTDIKALMKHLKKWDHDAVAITDHGIVQAFPDAYAAAKANGVRVLLGMEGYLVDDGESSFGADQSFDDSFVVFDIETTGLSPYKDKIIEIGAVRIEKGVVVSQYSSFVNPEMSIPRNIVELTGINDAMVADAPSIQQVLPEFYAFCGGATLVAHNIAFDASFIRRFGLEQGIEFDHPQLDTLTLSRQIYRDLRSHRLNLVAKHLGITLARHHRAVDDAAATAQILLKCFDSLRELGAKDLSDTKKIVSGKVRAQTLPMRHVILLAKNPVGLKNLYTLVTKSHLDYFYRRPRLPKSEIDALREGLIIGSACEAGELFQAFLNNESDERIREIAGFYDYFEIQPDTNNAFLIHDGVLSDVEALHRINKCIVQLGKEMGRPVVATCDVHFLEPHDSLFREILQHSQGYQDTEKQSGLYYRTTGEMLSEFSYLGEEDAYAVVVTNTRAIAASIESMQPIPQDLHPPIIEGAKEEILEMAWRRAREMYGEKLPEIVEKRLNRELDGIISNGYAVLYLIAQKLVKKSEDDGYMVGSRGSVGSSLAATFCGITEVNPLPPHYRCGNCRHSDFNMDGHAYGVGPDLPDKNCPHCGEPLIKDGYDIPFEVFMGFKGNKVPDIDLNFSGEYQANIHKYTEELFGEGSIFRAGTVGTIKDRTAYGYVRHFLEETQRPVNRAETERLVAGCTGIKRTTGQHPGGLIVLPGGYDIHQFTPLQHPANDKESGIITSHFEFSKLHDTLVKLDLLGHVDPTVLRMLEDITGVPARNVPLTDQKVLSLFTSTKALGIEPEDIGCEVGTFGIPEFGTSFVRQMLMDTRPTSMAELIRISGLSHGTDVWLGNAQEIINSGVATLREAICTRDDIMNYLIDKMDPMDAFDIMESVRKGKGVTIWRGGKKVDMEPRMLECGVPGWYVDSCKKISYMFPKAHAAAYVMMGLRIAYYKVYYPHAFYASYYTGRAGGDFDADTMTGDARAIRARLKELGAGKTGGLNAREKNLVAILEVVLEMYARGISFAPIDLYRSEAEKFAITENGQIRPPLSALAGLGGAAAQGIVEARAQGPFLSLEDLVRRSRISSAVVEALKRNHCVDGLNETDQISLL